MLLEEEEHKAPMLRVADKERKASSIFSIATVERVDLVALFQQLNRQGETFFCAKPKERADVLLCGD